MKKGVVFEFHQEQTGAPPAKKCEFSPSSSTRAAEDDKRMSSTIRRKN